MSTTHERLWYAAQRILFSNCGRRVSTDKMLPIVASIKSTEGVK